MIQLSQNLFRFWRFLILAGCLGAAAGCVDINDAQVQVRPPNQVDPYSRNVLDKCPSHNYPNRMFQGEVSAGSTIIQGSGVIVSNQQDFDYYWANLSSLREPNGNPEGTLKPVVDWEHASAHFLVLYLTDTCEKVDFLGMNTDCYDIFFSLQKTREAVNCHARGTNPAFVFIYPKTTLPISIQWVTAAVVSPTATPSPGPTPAGKP